MHEKYLNYEDSSIFYRINSSGKPVVLLHGFGENGTIWNPQIEFLQSKFQLIIPDLPGSGKSEMVKDMSMEGMATVIKEILVQEKISSCSMIGHSMGGYITLAFAEKYSSSLNAFGLFHSTSYPDSEDKKNTRRKGINFIREHGAFTFLKNITPGLFSQSSSVKMKKEIEAFIASLGYFTNDPLIAYYEAMIQRPDRRVVLQNSPVPVLFVIGQYDTVIPMNDLLQQAHFPDKSFIHILSESGHMGMIEEPEKSNSILLNFLNNI